MKIRAGSCRIVFVFTNVVLKVPNIINGWTGFIWGIQENLHERYWYSADGQAPTPKGERWSHEHLAQIYWADCFGFFVVMERADSLEHFTGKWNDELEESLSDLKFWSMKNFKVTDDHDGNLGITSDGRAVMIDYGFHARHHYIGDPVVYKDKERTRLTWSYRFFFGPIRKLRDLTWRLLDKLKIID